MKTRNEVMKLLIHRIDDVTTRDPDPSCFFSCTKSMKKHTLDTKVTSRPKFDANPIDLESVSTSAGSNSPIFKIIFCLKGMIKDTYI